MSRAGRTRDQPAALRLIPQTYHAPKRVDDADRELDGWGFFEGPRLIHRPRGVDLLRPCGCGGRRALVHPVTGEARCRRCGANLMHS